MIPIASETTLSISETALLLEKLVELEKKSPNGLPKRIQTCVKDHLEAQRKFVKSIDEYLHCDYEDEYVDEYAVESCLLFSSRLSIHPNVS